MQITKIKITNFKSIYDTLELNFNDMHGLWKISGSVGSGKTTIGEAIIYGLFGSINGKNNGDLISWGRKKGIIELYCISKGRNIYIKRELNAHGQSPTYVEVDGEELVFTNKRELQSQLESEYFDTTRTTLELLCIISFNNFKSIATLNTGETKKFLDQVLGFYILTKYSDKCVEFKNSNRSEITATQNQINSIQAQIDKLIELSNIELIDENTAELNESIRLINHNIKTLDDKFNEIKIEHNEKTKEINSNMSNIVALGKRLAKDIEFIEKGICPTCGAPIDQSHLSEKKAEKDLLMKQYQLELNESKLLNEMFTKQSDQFLSQKNELIRERDSYNATLIRIDEQKKRIKVNTEHIDTLKCELEKLSQILAHHKNEDQQWCTLQSILVEEVRTKILDSFINILNQNIFKYSKYLQLPYTIRFDANFKCSVATFGFDKDIPVSSLSTGQLKVVDMVIILGVLDAMIGLNGVNIIFLDELFSNLDAKLRDEMCKILKDCTKEDQTIFIISHTELNDAHFDGEIKASLLQSNVHERHTSLKIEHYRN